MKKYLIFIMGLLCFLPNIVSAAPYEMITYDIDVKVNENRIATIEEEYNIYFIQKVDTFNKVFNNKLTTIRPDGSKRTTSAIVSNIVVMKENSKLNYKLENNIIHIDDISQKDTVKKYKISYQYDYGTDTGVGFDELFIELINGKIDANISSINFKIELPKSIDASKVKFLHNSKYIDTTTDVTYSVNENIISGVLNRNLKSNESFSFYIELDDNYFSGASDNYNYLIFLLILVPIATTILAIIYYKKYRKNNKLNIILDDEIPHNYDSAEIAYLYNGYLKEHDLLTVLIAMANEGYITFNESDDGYKLESINTFTIEKQKDYDGQNAASKLIFEKLFQDKDIIELKDIEYNLYDTLMDAKNSIDNIDNQQKLFFKNVTKDKKILSILILISTLVMNFNSIYLFSSNYLMIPIIVALMIFGMYVMFIANTKLLIKIIFGLLLIGSTLYIGISPIMNDIRTLLLYIIGMILVFISTYIYKILPFRTKYGNEILSEIYGFKNFLEKMSISTLKEKIEQNPNYFYEMYPYIYIFDLTDIWIRKGENLIKEYPIWYLTKEEFSLANFQKFVKNMIFTVTQSMFKRQLTGQSRVHVEYHKEKKEEL